MRKLITLLISATAIISCVNSDKTENENKTELTAHSFSEYRELTFLKNYEKVTDTSYIKSGGEPTHRITQLKRSNEILILFNKISIAENFTEKYSILDTLRITDLRPNSYISIGYCESKNLLPEEIIALLEKTEEDTIQKVLKAWKANSETSKIEKLDTSKILRCLNEF